uniref:Uncharacterized protein n=1 Tax=Panagrolaimus sp. JU765 TaxID=591449 RepID=A0AC34RRX0_9BILA
MLVVAWLLVVQVCGILAEDVDLTENKTYRFIVSKEGFRVKICGSGSGNPLLCYDGFRDRSTGDPLHTKCPDFTSCVIKAEYKTEKKLLVYYGGGVGHFKSECAVIKVQETIQYGLDTKKNLSQNGGCHWTSDAKGMLGFDVTTAVGFTMTILNVTQVPDVDESAVPFWVYIVSGVGALAVIAGLGVGGFFLYRFIKKRRNDGQTVKEGEKNDPKAITTQKDPRLQEETANFVGQSRERGTKEKVE